LTAHCIAHCETVVGTIHAIRLIAVLTRGAIAVRDQNIVGHVLPRLTALQRIRGAVTVLVRIRQTRVRATVVRTAVAAVIAALASVAHGVHQQTTTHEHTRENVLFNLVWREGTQTGVTQRILDQFLLIRFIHLTVRMNHALRQRSKELQITRNKRKKKKERNKKKSNHARK
jgi:hypothetical protein